MLMVKGRNWAFVVYPESLPSNWEEIIIETGLPMAFSPLHDSDLNPTGEPKKPHYHVICYYENPTTSRAVKEYVSDKLNGTIPIKLESMTGMYRYHIHMDNPEKFQYNDKDRMFFNGFDTNKVDSLTFFEIDKTLRDLQNFIRKEDILEYNDLLDILLDNELYQSWTIARTQTIFFNTYLASRRNKPKKKENNQLPIIDILQKNLKVFMVLKKALFI